MFSPKVKKDCSQNKKAVLANASTAFSNCLYRNYNVPLKPCSLSMDSNKALKFPAPKPLAPIR